jgi:UDP-glucose:(heptosyl)LPS alpha-1,3-glucosyltransferase
LDHLAFNPERCFSLRVASRAALGLGADRCAILLVGNDWRKKGLFTLIDALERLKDRRTILLVAGKDDEYPYQKRLRERGLEGKVRFVPSRPDVNWYYAAADIYVGPSLEDTFAQPPAEAMACGLPVVTTVTNGTAEIITDGVDGLLVQNPNDADELANKIRLLLDDPELRRRMGDAAAQTAKKYTWDRNGDEIRGIFAGVLARKRSTN